MLAVRVDIVREQLLLPFQCIRSRDFDDMTCRHGYRKCTGSLELFLLDGRSARRTPTVTKKTNVYTKKTSKINPMPYSTA